MKVHLAYIVDKVAPFRRLELGKLVYEKEFIYVGKFAKKTPEGTQRFEVADATIDHWVSLGNTLIERGIEVPVPVGHTFEAGAKVGKVLKFYRGTHSDGRAALMGHVEFVDEEKAAAYEHSNVSIYTEEEFTDGLGNDYKWPILHVAVTDYPVIPDLSPFRAIAASLIGLDQAPKGNKRMNEKLKEILDALGLEVPDDASDDTGFILVKNAVVQLKEQVSGKKPEEKKPEETDKKEEDVEKAAASFSLSIVNTVRDARVAKIDGLVTSGKIVKTVRDDLVSKYADEKSVRLSLARDKETSEFDQVIGILAKNDPVVLREQTGGQHLPLSHNFGKSVVSDDALTKDAEARAKR